MAAPNSPFDPPVRGAGPAKSGGTPRQPRLLPPPVPSSDLDAKLGALLAEGTAGVTEPPEPRRRSAATLILGGALVVGAGLGLGWGIGRATRSGDSDKAVTVSSVGNAQTVPPGAVSDAPPSGDDATPAGSTGETPATAAGNEPTTGSIPVAPPETGEPALSTPLVEPSAATPSVAETTAGDSNTNAPPITTQAVVPSPTSPAPVASPAAAPTSVVEVGPSPTVVASPRPGSNVLPTAFAVLEDGRLTLRGTFADQVALDQAITALGPLGTNGLAVEAVVDPSVVGSRQVPVLVSDAAIFQAGSAILGGDAQPVLDVFASAMTATSTSRLIIEGHTDAQGSDAYNFALSQQRIAAVFAYLVGKGVDPARLELAPKGETEPLADNATVEGRSRNRRVELIFST
jgi:outer membrane protein OmpA-like peptidoglycan-associated protein